MKKGIVFLASVFVLFFSSTMVFGAEAPAIHHQTLINYGKAMEFIQVENVPPGCFVRTFKNGKIESRITPQNTAAIGDAAIPMDDVRTAILLDQGSSILKTEVVCRKKVIATETWEVYIAEPMRVKGAAGVMSDSSLSNGLSRILGKYVILITNNDLLEFELKEMVLNVNTSAGVSVNNIGVYIEGDSMFKTPLANSDNGHFQIDLSGFIFAPETETITFVVFGNITGTDVADSVSTGLVGIEYYNGYETVNPGCLDYVCFPIPGATLSN